MNLSYLYSSQPKLKSIGTCSLGKSCRKYLDLVPPLHKQMNLRILVKEGLERKPIFFLTPQEHSTEEDFSFLSFRYSLKYYLE